MKLGWKLWVAATLALTTFAGCMTPAEKWISENLTTREKSDLLVDRGNILFAQMLDADSLEDITRVRAVFQTAKTTDAGNPRPTEALKKLETFVTKRQTDAQAKVKSLTAKSTATLSDKEKYDLVVVFQQLQILAPPNFDLSKLSDQVLPIRAEVIKRSTQTIADYEKALNGTKSDAAAGKMISAIHDSVVSLQVIDPANAQAKAANERLAKFLVDRNQADVTAASKAYAAKDYAGAAKLLVKVEQALAGVGSDNTAEVDALLYKVYFDWSKDLFTAKKYGEASSRVQDALGVNATSEASDLRDKISKAATAKDYDAEYDSVDKQLDALVTSGDLKTAWNLASATGPQLKKDDTKAKLASRKKQILDAAHALYDSAVVSYNEEDYREAKLGFDVVVAIDPAWQLVKSYQDKAKAKLQALGGKP
jgi:hypothetical protein